MKNETPMMCANPPVLGDGCSAWLGSGQDSGDDVFLRKNTDSYVNLCVEIYRRHPNVTRCRSSFVIRIFPPPSAVFNRNISPCWSGPIEAL
jgi:hypothetical protein